MTKVEKRLILSWSERQRKDKSVMHIFYITFGPNERNHLQVHFSVMSILAGPRFHTGISVLTDSPAFYKSIEKQVNVVELSAGQLEDWAGPFRYFWRIKIKGLEFMCEKYPQEPVMYLDSDTFLYGRLQPIGEGLRNGTAYMHRDEGPLANIRTKTARTMTRQLQRLPVEGLSDPGRHSMWNAGVVATPNSSNGAEIALALRLCDEMCRLGIKPYFIEQFAHSVALNTMYPLKAAAGAIAHYWSNKDEWNQTINAFFVKAYLQQQTLQETIQAFTRIRLDQVPETRIIKSSRVRLQKLVGRILRDKQIGYVSTITPQPDHNASP